MKKRALKKSVILMLALLFIPTMLSGCYNYREIEHVLLVMGIAYDMDKETGEYCLNIETVNFTGSGQSMETKSVLISSKGDSIFDASRNSVDAAGKKSYWRHKQIAIIGKSIAEGDIFSIIDMITRDADPRMSIYLVVSKEDTAEEIMQSKMPGYEIVSNGIYDALENSSGTSAYIPMQVYQVNTDLLADGISLVLPTVFLGDNNGEKTVNVAGSAVFKEEKLIGYLDADETKYLTFAKDMIEGGLITMTDPENGHTITLEIFNNSTDIIPEMTDQGIKIKIKTNTEVSLAELDYYLKNSTKENLDRIAALGEDTIKENLLAVVKKVQQDFGTDSFGFGAKVKKKTPEIWKLLEDDWDSYFANLQVEVECKVTIKNTGWRQ